MIQCAFMLIFLAGGNLEDLGVNAQAWTVAESVLERYRRLYERLDPAGLDVYAKDARVQFLPRTTDGAAHERYRSIYGLAYRNLLEVSVPNARLREDRYKVDVEEIACTHKAIVVKGHRRSEADANTARFLFVAIPSLDGQWRIIREIQEQIAR